MKKMNFSLSLIKLISVFMLILFLMGFSSGRVPNEALNISLPTPKIEHFSDHTFDISEYSPIVNTDYIAGYKSALLSLKSTIATYGTNNQSKTEVVFQMVTDLDYAIPKYKKYIDLPESYAIQFSNKKIVVQAKSGAGLLNGLTTLEYYIIKNQGKLKQGLIIDYPDIRNRVLQLTLRTEDLETYQSLIRLARFNHYNKLILLIIYNKGVNLQSINHLDTVGSMSKQEFEAIVNYAKGNGLEVIPELRLLSHQEGFFGDSHPKLMFNKDTYNPLNKNVYKYVFAAIDEVVKLTGATKFHIGHDEVKGVGESQLPANLFLKDVIILNNYLNSKNIETWMGGDMLISNEQFPILAKAGGLHGNKSYTNLLNKIPKNITITDWHYWGQQKKFPSTYEFAKAGFKVYGVTWRNKLTTRNFAAYVTTMPENVKGMIATTWFRLDRKSEEVIGIINYSGEIFWNAKDYDSRNFNNIGKIKVNIN